MADEAVKPVGRPAVPVSDAVGPMPASFRKFWLPILRKVAGAFLFFLGPVKVRGARRVPKQGGVLVLANHLSDIDPVVVQYACPRVVRFMSKSELFEMSFIGKVLPFFGAFPVKRGEPDRQALKLSANLLKAGEVVGIFPEGQLSEDGTLQELKPGVALIARMAGVPVICCALMDTQRIMPYAKVWPRPAFRKVHAVWGEPRSFGKEASNEEVLEWAAAQFHALSGRDRPGIPPP